MSKRLPITQALRWILLSALLISGTAAASWFSYYYLKEYRKNSDAYRIVAIIQSTPHERQLDHQFIAQLLELSLDRPQNLYSFNSRHAKGRLESLPIIKQCDVKKIPPGTIQVSYMLCQPVGMILDYSNTAIDGEGRLFPYLPFYRDLELPRIYLGMKPLHNHIWGTQLQGDTLTLAFEIAAYLKEHILSEFIELESIDVSKAFDENYGKREIVVTFQFFDEGEWRPLSLRMGTASYEATIKNFYILYRHIIPNRHITVVDMRIPYLAFIPQRNLM